MTTLSEITDLFAKLASRIRTPALSEEEEEEALDLSISKLNRSLNLDEDDGSRVRVLDTALSLMCFRAPQVYDSVIGYTVKSTVSVLSSSISCKVLRFQKEEMLQIGCSISSCDCVELIEACIDVIGKLEEYGEFDQSLAYTIVRVLVSASSYQYLFPSMPIYDVKSVDARRDAVSRLLRHLPKEISHKKDEIPLRLQLWYLDPLTLKSDISKVLQDFTRRPFLCLNKEFHERMEWHSIIVCLVLSPTSFIKTRALLHNWFLLMGLASVMDLIISLVTVILDVLSRPTWWGISEEMGLKLPFSDAYFPYKHQLMRILDGPLLSERILDLVHTVSKEASHASSTKQAATKAGIVDHKSNWAIAMNFPEWFFFASLLLFSQESFQGDFNSKCSSGASKSEQSCDVKSSSSAAAAAARYIAWILSPFSQSHQVLLGDLMTKISESWTLKQLSKDMHNKEKTGYRKNLKKPKFHESKDHSLLKGNDCQIILSWLEEFQDTYNRCWDYTLSNSVSHEGKLFHGLSPQQSILFRRIPLSILIGCSDGINEDGCELLLHYAATGIVLQSREDSVIWTKECNSKEAVAGASLVFYLTDIVEKMSASMFDSEESAFDFVCQVKARIVKYLIKCITKLLELTIDETQMLMDVCTRLLQWRQQGREVPQCQKDLDDVIEALSYQLSSLQGKCE